MNGQKQVVNGFLEDLAKDDAGFTERKQMAALLNQWKKNSDDVFEELTYGTGMAEYIDHYSQLVSQT